MWLSPRLSTVHEGTSEQLQIVTVNPLADLTGKVIYPEQAPAGKAYEIYDWSINGVVTGDAVHGRIWPTGTGKNLGTYTAPGSKPNPSTVTASVNLKLTNLGYTQLIAQINIGEPGTYTGNWYLISSGIMGFSASGTATISPHKLSNGDYDDGIDMTNFDLQITAVLDNKSSITFGTDACTCSDAAKTQTYSHVNEVTVFKIPYRMDWHFAVNWPVTCTGPGGSTYNTYVSISWRTYCEPRKGSDDGTWGIPLANPNRLSGVYSLSASCPAVLSTQSMGWDFSQ
jgi:hypothetical protein